MSVPIAGRFSTDSGEALRAAAVAGMGVVLQPYELLADEIEAGRLTRLLPKFEPLARPLHALYASDKRMTPKLRSFLDFVFQKFGMKSPAHPQSEQISQLQPLALPPVRPCPLNRR